MATVSVICDNCGKPFERRRDKVKKNKYCTPKCAHVGLLNTPEDFWRRVDIRGPEECWPWLGTKQVPQGYGRIGWNGRKRPAHSLAHELTYGPTPGKHGPKGIMMRHTCDNPPCCNPAHIIPGTALDNVMDRQSRGRHNNPKGEQSTSAKLTEKEVLEIRADPRSHAAVGKAYGISAGNVYTIRSRRSWAHI